MNRLTENYIAVNEGRMTKAEFVRQTKQGFPGIVTPCNTYDDIIQILRKKQMLSEEVVYQCKGDKFPLESIERGLRWELKEMGILNGETPTSSEYKKARCKAIDNLCKDPEYYLKKLEQKTLQEDAKPSKRAPRDRSYDHNWSFDDYVVAYVIETWGKKGIEKILERCGLNGGQPTQSYVATYIINCSTAALSLVLQAFRKVFEDDFSGTEKEFLASYKLHHQAFNSVLTKCEGKSLEQCVQMIDPDRVGSKEADISGLEKKEQSKRDRANSRQRETTKKKDDLRVKIQSLMNKISDYRMQRVPQDRIVKYAKKSVGWTSDDEENAKKWGLWDKNILKEMYRGAEDKTKKAIQKSKNIKKEQDLLKEAIKQRVVKILSEAATNNLAQLSDENASVQDIPAILNSLENIVTEIESFILKEQGKVQGVFDSLGNIRNEDNIPIGYKFVQPVLDAFKKDLEPVLQKVTLDNLKLPEAPEPEQGKDLNLTTGGEDSDETKQTVFSPKDPNLMENKQPRKRYTR